MSQQQYFSPRSSGKWQMWRLVWFCFVACCQFLCHRSFPYSFPDKLFQIFWMGYHFLGSCNFLFQDLPGSSLSGRHTFWCFAGSIAGIFVFDALFQSFSQPISKILTWQYYLLIFNARLAEIICNFAPRNFTLKKRN